MHVGKVMWNYIQQWVLYPSLFDRHDMVPNCLSDVENLSIYLYIYILTRICNNIILKKLVYSILIYIIKLLNFVLRLIIEKYHFYHNNLINYEFDLILEILQFRTLFFPPHIKTILFWPPQKIIVIQYITINLTKLHLCHFSAQIPHHRHYHFTIDKNYKQYVPYTY